MSNAVKHITAEPIKARAYLKRIWQYRLLIRALAIRDLKSMFAQTRLGWLWLLIKPLFILGLFSIFFDNLLNLETGTIPYPVFAFSGMTLWYFFSNLSNSVGGALLQSTDLMRKIYFPKMALLIAKSSVAFIELVFHLLILVVLCLFYGYYPTLQWLLVLPMIILVYLAGFGIGLWINNLSIQYRDMHHLIPQLVNVAIWLTPVFYPVTIIPEQYRMLLYVLNPMASAIDGIRTGLFALSKLSAVMPLNFLLTLLLCVAGFFVFIRKEKNLIDRL